MDISLLPWGSLAPPLILGLPHQGYDPQIREGSWDQAFSYTNIPISSPYQNSKGRG
jgi:hypothetical protein